MPPVKKPKQKKTETNAAEEDAIPVVSGQLKKKIQKQKQKAADKRGVIFIKHLPHGFFEDQLKKYFEQFGTVTRLRLARSRRTGGSKGFAFVEFEYPEVAQVAAETMDNYLMFKKVVKAAYIPPNEQKYNYFKSTVRKVKNKAGKEIYISNKTAAIQRKVNEHNNWSENAYQKRTKANLKKINKLKKKYEHLGIDFADIIMAPKKVEPTTAKEETSTEPGAVSQGASSTPKAKIGKRKNSLSTPGSIKTQKQSKKEVALEDLLGNTIPDDSDDEDYEVSKDDDEATSDEESYGFLKESDDEELDAAEDDDDDDDEEDDEDADESVEQQMIPLKSNKKMKKLSYEKPTKPTKVNVDRLEKMIKRKPHLGGIKKANKKPVSKVVVSKAKKAMQVEAVKELTKAKAGASTRKPVKKTKLAKKQKA